MRGNVVGVGGTVVVLVVLWEGSALVWVYCGDVGGSALVWVGVQEKYGGKEGEALGQSQGHCPSCATSSRYKCSAVEDKSGKKGKSGGEECGRGWLACKSMPAVRL